ncbi:copine-3 isoform X2 [Aplysia californica]|uniref:Copine-3 isoform X2 n=1 Tax=Aplysia californica TaxID=6500 RepID=A0ABM1VXL1_APLCA|nr:copine-3 isoform X2 [Aplysia californica]
MSQYGGPPSGAPPYPQSQGTPYPAQGQGSAPYPAQGQGSAPYPAQGQGSAPYPAQGQGSAPYPPQGQGSAPYPAQGQGHSPYPSQDAFPQLQTPGQAAAGAAPYPSGPYPNPAASNPSAPPKPSPPPRPTTGPGQGQQGQAPYPGQSPYPAQGQPPHGQTPYPGQAPYPAQGQAPYPAQGQAPFPGQGNPPHGQSPYPGQGHPQGQAPYPGQGQAPYPGQASHAGQGHAPYPGQGHQPPAHSAYPGQTQGQGANAPRGGAGGRATNPGADQFKSRVEIRIECKNLLNKDVMSKSDPCAAFYMMRAGRWEEMGRTENVINCLNPRFSQSFVVNYFFEEVQKLLIAVYDLDNSTPQLTDDDFLGQIETTLGQVVSNTPLTAPLLLRNGRKAGQGTISISAEEIKEGTESVHLTFRAQKLDNKDFLGKSDPYLEIQRATPDGRWQVVHRTEVIKNNLNPSWRPFQLSLQTLCGGNRQQNIKIDCYDWDSDGSHDYIGGLTTTFDEMSKAAQQETSWPCVNPSKKAKKRNYKNSGIIVLTTCKLFKEHSFLDYITGGMQINFTVGIDFTASNGNPAQTTSLHYINPYQPNEYMGAIKAVGEVCQDYDTDKLFPALGFGAKIPPNWQVSHEFAINFNPQNPYCQGIDGVLQAYYNCIQTVQLYGPTNAAPIIQHVSKFAAMAQREEGSKGAHAYFVLLMLTDGVLSDMSNTRSAIVAASELPMSLIIVGVGNADFSDMEILDGDNGVLRAPGGQPCKRDIVQFVPFREFKNSTPVELARSVLAEVPKQVTGYYKMRGMQPLKNPRV